MMGRVYYKPSSTVHFGRVVADLIRQREKYLSRSGNVNWAWFADDLKTVNYETLRKAISGERWPSQALLEAVSELLGVDPSVFLRYRLNVARSLFDPHEVGFEAAVENLRRWAAGDKLFAGDGPPGGSAKERPQKARAR